MRYVYVPAPSLLKTKRYFARRIGKATFTVKNIAYKNLLRMPFETKRNIQELKSLHAALSTGFSGSRFLKLPA